MQTARSLISREPHELDLPSAVRPPPVYRCACCRTVTHLSDLNDDMLCEACGEPDEDPDFIIDMSPEAMLREHCTWSL